MSINIIKLITIIRNPHITPIAKTVLMDLLFYAGKSKKAFPSQKTLAKNHGFSDRYIRSVLDELKSNGLILGWKRRGYSLSNLYRLNPELYFQTERKSSSHENGSTIPFHSGTPNPSKDIQERFPDSSELLLHVEKVFGRKLKPSEIKQLQDLRSRFAPTWIKDAVSHIGTSDPKYKYLKVGLIEKILEDWDMDGKPEPKPNFTPCNKNGCENGFIRTENGYRICNCKEQFYQKLQEWKKNNPLYKNI